MDLVQDAEKLLRIFGRWPSFHDAEVIGIALDRTGREGPVLEARIHVFEMTSELDDRGYYVLQKHTLATLGFTEVLLQEFSGFNHQNVLSDLEISGVDPSQSEGRSLKVEFSPSFGLALDFLCTRAIVMGAEPFDIA
jgi:hypothetical protein